ncbi:DNA cytosine methyltransferase [Nitratireductor rhodophyticola]|uniref:DNA cytosine methyltransferase n=1 Tax=Nitratireductor rhodophyticola TaxID=2854036 RepID=UPI003BA8A4A9
MQKIRKPKKMLVADLLCGAGGSSTGASRALAELGLDMELVCVNHWPTAIDTHQRNHPEARHFVQDIATVRPHILVPEGYLDLLMASPTCTHHSVARGGKPTSDQQRSDPWHIITWLTELRVKRIIIENVWEFTSWGPVDRRTGRPIKSRKGEYFHAWIETLKRLGFDPEWRKLNAADYGDATTRQRFILMARSDRRKVHWPMPTHRKRSEVKGELFSDAKPWRSAREIIDWSIKGRSIFNRKKALAPKTLMRIYAGAVKHKWPEPFIVVLRNHMAAQGLDVPLPTIAANGQHIALAEPVIMNGRKGNQAKAVSTEPVPTLDTKGGVWLAEPMVLSQHNSGAARSASDPLPTITTGGAGTEVRPGCARPMLVTVAHGTDARDKDPYTRRAHDIEDPLGTVHGDGSSYAVVEPFVLSQASGGSPRAVSDPLPTSTTGGAGGAHALISAYYGANSTCTSDAEPLPTVTTKDRFGVVVPVTHAGGENRAHDVNGDPLPTITGANRGELAFITAQFGEREGQAPRTHDLGEPLPVGPTLGQGALIEPGQQFDILFRMLEPHELASAMGFNTEDQQYEFAGTKTDKIKQIGNAVSVAKMKACVGAIMADAAPKEIAKCEAEFMEAAE